MFIFLVAVVFPFLVFRIWLLIYFGVGIGVGFGVGGVRNLNYRLAYLVVLLRLVELLRFAK